MVEVLSTIVRRKPEQPRLFLFAIYNPIYIFLAGSPRFQPFGETRHSRHVRAPMSSSSATGTGHCLTSHPRPTDTDTQE